MKKVIKSKLENVCVYEIGERSSRTGRVVTCSHPSLVKNTRHFCNGEQGKTYITMLCSCEKCEFFELTMPLLRKPVLTGLPFQIA